MLLIASVDRLHFQLEHDICRCDFKGIVAFVEASSIDRLLKEDLVCMAERVSCGAKIKGRNP